MTDLKEQKNSQIMDMHLVAPSHLLKLQMRVFLQVLKQPEKKCGTTWENPNDLPEDCVINQDGKRVLYDHINKVWRNDDADEYICDDPIAWCEIPTFEA